ncbi:hypothetical protein [Nocardia nova]|uniref:hypothetical protein n=1 Tax=Nocardia nova TaxID=37330 RepID=UPI0027383E77|nr:hypothetical protein [Nocardia nova]
MRDETIANSYRIHLAETRDHVLTIKHDDGLYRHLRCAKPGTGIYSFDIVTWPGHLSIGGDIDGYVFARIPDMFEFFTLHGGGIDPGYWGEKVVTRSESRPDRDFSSDAFKSAVVGEFMSQRDRFPGESRELFRRIREDVIQAGGEYAESAHAALHEFRYRSPESGKTFEFGDWWEMNLTDWSPNFLRACWAIVWGIEAYRKAKAEQQAVPA